MDELDTAKEYTVCYQKIIDRQPYFPKSEPTCECTYPFCPVEKNKPIRLYHISDSHGRVEQSVTAANTYFDDDIDLLILNGDIADHSSSVENISMIYRIASGITEGKKPCVLSRGNHDMRGAFAEHLAEYVPTDNGLTYFTFRLGDLWGLVLDCAEDKSDDHAEYGGTICCHEYRLAETEFLKELAQSREYDAKGISYKMVICHAPFTCRDMSSDGIFDIENDIYNEWVQIINEDIKPNLFLAGHKHCCVVSYPEDEYDSYGQKFPVIIGAKPQTLSRESGFTGTAICFEKGKITAHFTDSAGGIVSGAEIKL